MADFPCGVCKIDCEIDVIQCSYCEFWFHIQCISMKKSDLHHNSTSFVEIVLMLVMSTMQKRHWIGKIFLSFIHFTVGTKNRTTSNHREYSVSSMLYTCRL